MPSGFWVIDMPDAAEKTQVGGDHYVAKAVQPWHAMAAWMSHEQFV